MRSCLAGEDRTPDSVESERAWAFGHGQAPHAGDWTQSSPEHLRYALPGTLRFWHVTLTLAGQSRPPEVVRRALTRLGDQHAFLHSMRYSAHQAEIAYWEEAEDMLDAAAMALRVWHEHRRSAGLPQWEVVGLEVLERETLGARQPRRTLVGLGAKRPQPVPF